MAEGGEKRNPVTHRTPTQKRKDGRKRAKLPEEKRKNTLRRAAQRAMIKAGKSKIGDGIDVTHKQPLARGGSNTMKNLGSGKPSDNRSHKLGTPKKKRGRRGRLPAHR